MTINDHLRAALEASEEGIIATDSEWRIMLWNRGAERMFGWTADEALSQPVFAMHMRGVAPEHIEQYRAELLAGRSVRLTGLRFRKDGSEIHVDSQVTPMLDDTGRYVGALGTVRDITPLVDSERALRLSEEKFAKAFHANPDFTMISRLSDGLIIEANEGFEKLLGIGAAEAVGQMTVANLHMWADPADRDHMVRLLEEQGRVRDLPATFVRRGGEHRVVLISAIVIDVADEPHIIGTARDITDLKRSQEALSRSEERFAAYFRNNPDYSTVSRLSDGKFVDVNQAFEELTGWRREEVIGRTTLDIALYADPREREWLVRELEKHGVVRDFELHFRMRSGEIRLVQGAVVKADLDGEPHIIGVARDITEQRQAVEAIRNLNVELERRVSARTAELEGALRELESFSYSISHDLRSPLRAIAGYAKIIEEDYGAQLDAEGCRLLNRIVGGAIRMSDLIDDLLDFSRIGRAELRKVPIEMTGLVREVLAEMPEAGSGHNLRLDIGALPSAVADRGLIRQVWFNLLSNAIKYSRGRDPMTIEIGGGLGEGAAHFFVRDNGAGFDMEYAGKLFHAFQRLHRDDHIEGTGVGLAIVARIVQRHGGRVWAEAEPDQGATFHFTLPVA